MITLINPSFPSHNTDYFFYMRGKYPHPSLSYISGYLQKRGIDVDIIDSKFNELNFTEIIGRLAKSDNKIIGITSNTSEINNTHKLIEAIKHRIKDAFVVLGGIHACALPEETINNNPFLDALVCTEGEEILYQLAISRNLSETLPRLDGMLYREANGKIKKNPPKQLPSSLADYGPAAYQHWPGAKKFFAMTQRGCPYACSFCFRALGKKVRLRDVADVMADLEYIARTGKEPEVLICDPTFGINRPHTEEILNQIIQNNLNKYFKWSCTTRVDVMTADLLKHMKEAGCKEVAFGIESGSDRILQLTGKNTKITQAMAIVDSAKKLGIQTIGYYVFGHIDETKDELQQTVRAIWKINTDEVRIGVMVPWPGTKVYELAKVNKGGYRLLSEDYDKFDKYFGEVMHFENYSLKYLDVMRILAFVKLYAYNYRFKELFQFIKDHYKQGLKKLKQLMKY